MDQFNNNTYKKPGLAQEFYGSCLGKIIILAIVAVILLVIAIITVPSNKQLEQEMEDNIRQCLIDNDSIRVDVIDEVVGNVGRTFTEADSTYDVKELMDAYHKYNTLTAYNHTFYSTALLTNSRNPQGLRVGLGLFGMVIPTVYFSDLVLDNGTVRGEYEQKLIQDVIIPDDDLGENPAIRPYHYKGNPDD